MPQIDVASPIAAILLTAAGIIAALVWIGVRIWEKRRARRAIDQMKDGR